MRRASTALLLPLALAACAVGPDYRPPPTQVPERFSQASAPGISEDAAGLARWWTQLNDPRLDALIERAIQGNLDLRAAVARVREAGAARGVVSAGLWPFLDASGSYTRSRQSANVPTAPPVAGERTTDLYRAGLDVSWELDVFGGTRRSVEAADATIEATEEDRRDVLVTMVAEVARSYLELRALQRRLDVARENIRVQRDTWELTRVRFEAGVISNLDVVRAEAQLRTTESQVPVLETGLRQAVHRLSVLLGSEPGALAAELAPVGPLPVEPPVVPVGLPSTLLARRPDVRRAERELAVATAAIGVATADLYPRFSLTGGGGVESTRLEDLARGGSVYWFVGPSFSWPIFHAGAIRANIRVQDARAEQALARYEQTVLVSLREVEDALVAYAQERERRARLTEAVTADRSAVELARELNDRGLVDFLNVLDAQRSLYLVEDQLVQSDQAVVTNLVLLYKALGGGWEG